MKEEADSKRKFKNSTEEPKDKQKIISGFLNFTKPSSDDVWGDDFIDGIDVHISNGNKGKTIEDQMKHFRNWELMDYISWTLIGVLIFLYIKLIFE